jgi:hypothetical protein
MDSGIESYIIIINTITNITDVKKVYNIYANNLYFPSLIPLTLSCVIAEVTSVNCDVTFDINCDCNNAIFSLLLIFVKKGSTVDILFVFCLLDNNEESEDTVDGAEDAEDDEDVFEDGEEAFGAGASSVTGKLFILTPS